MNTDNKRIAYNTMFLYIRMLLIMVISLYTSRVALNALGVSDFGIFNVVGGLITLFSFLNGCMIEASTRFIMFELGKGQNLRLNKVFNSTLVIHSLLALLVFVLSETIGVWFLYNKMVIPQDRINAAFWVFQFSIFTSIITITQVPYNALIIAHEKMKIYAYISIVEALAKLIIVYYITITSFDKLILYAFSFFVLQLVVLSYYRIYCTVHFEESHFCLCKEKSIYKGISKFAGYEFIGSIAYVIQGQGVNLLLNLFFGPVVNAARGIAFQVQTAVMQFNNNFLMAVRPNLIKKYASLKFKDMETLTIRTSCLSYYMMLMIMLPIMIESKNILSLWLGQIPNHTQLFLILVLVNCLIQIPGGARNIVYKASGKVKRMNIAKTIITCLLVLASYIWLKITNGQPESAFFFVIIASIINEVINIVLFFSEVEGINYNKYIYQVYVRCFFVTLLVVIINVYFHSMVKVDLELLSVLITFIISIISVSLISLFGGIDKETRKGIFLYIKNKYS